MTEEQLDKLLYYIDHPEELDENAKAKIDRFAKEYKKELAERKRELKRIAKEIKDKEKLEIAEKKAQDKLLLEQRMSLTKFFAYINDNLRSVKFSNLVTKLFIRINGDGKIELRSNKIELFTGVCMVLEPFDNKFVEWLKMGGYVEIDINDFLVLKAVKSKQGVGECITIENFNMLDDKIEIKYNKFYKHKIVEKKDITTSNYFIEPMEYYGSADYEEEYDGGDEITLKPVAFEIRSFSNNIIIHREHTPIYDSNECNIDTLDLIPFDFDVKSEPHMLRLFDNDNKLLLKTVKNDIFITLKSRKDKEPPKYFYWYGNRDANDLRPFICISKQDGIGYMFQSMRLV